MGCMQGQHGVSGGIQQAKRACLVCLHIPTQLSATAAVLGWVALATAHLQLPRALRLQAATVVQSCCSCISYPDLAKSVWKRTSAPQLTL